MIIAIEEFEISSSQTEIYTKTYYGGVAFSGKHLLFECHCVYSYSIGKLRNIIITTVLISTIIIASYIL